MYLAVEAVALVSLVAAAEERAEGVGAVAEHVARPVLALVVVRHVAALQKRVKSIDYFESYSAIK